MSKYIIVLGYNLNNFMADIINKQRINLALTIYNPGDTLILSGGDVDDIGITEAEYLLSLIDNKPIDIILDITSLNTIDNIYNCREYINNDSVIVTHEYHKPRTKHIQETLLTDVSPVYITVPNNTLPDKFLKELQSNELFYYNQIDQIIN